MSSSFPLGASCLCEPTERVGLSGTIFEFIGETNCWGCSWTRSQLYLLVYTFFVCLFWESNAQQKECLTINLYNIFYNYGYTLIFSEIYILSLCAGSFISMHETTACGCHWDPICPQFMLWPAPLGHCFWAGRRAALLARSEMFCSLCWTLAKYTSRWESFGKTGRICVSTDCF